MWEMGFIGIFWCVLGVKHLIEIARLSWKNTLLFLYWSIWLLVACMFCDNDNVVLLVCFPLKAFFSLFPRQYLLYLFPSLLLVRCSSFISNRVFLVYQLYCSYLWYFHQQVLQNYEDILRKNQFYLEDKAKLRSALAGLVRCLSLLPCNKRKVDSSEEVPFIYKLWCRQFLLFPAICAVDDTASSYCISIDIWLFHLTLKHLLFVFCSYFC